MNTSDGSYAEQRRFSRLHRDPIALIEIVCQLRKGHIAQALQKQGLGLFTGVVDE
ncbi:hypothetical protein IFT37_07335 [Pseudomonas fluorescens]|nr:hypothetical protein [Pseudomonas fluorescens]MBD8176026.1 hypothetical protein [Pseudomonas fluorescens]MBD8744912.1 hypothetical protein [Pseudomonas fluorescens]MBD8748698.1 hypothetical protein [Pseudomonas fluorescens]MBD8762039.1 hypothetical protein [Pseudomonas fluorescens]